MSRILLNLKPSRSKVALNAMALSPLSTQLVAAPAQRKWDQELTGWARCAKEVWTFEDKRMDRCKDDINHLLLYAGLVSTALTGFIVPFHGFQAQTVDPTVQVLALIAMQLNVKLLMTKGEAWSCAVKRSCHGRSSPIC